jgi:LuxR family maltose regulon positive regulatory protein
MMYQKRKFSPARRGFHLPELLLSTKFFIPPTRPGLVTRPRLLKSLGNALGLPLTILTAPPGFGKTTLLAEWANYVKTFERPNVLTLLAWLSLDSDDNGLARFWTYTIAALQKAMGSSLRESPESPVLAEVQGLLAGTPPPFQIFLTLLINEISTILLPVVLILDDYHVIQDPGISESVAYLVDHIPANLHLVIASRTDPPLPLGRWRARGQLNSLRAQELRFSQDEAVEFLNGTMGLSLSQENVAELDQRTEGWAAGLQMAAFALQDEDEAGAARAIQAFSGRHHFLLDFFTGEILARQPEEIQQFLLRTSVLDRMCGPLCDAVLGTGKLVDWETGKLVDWSPLPNLPIYQPTNLPINQSPSQKTLEYLERANLFVIPLDTERRWYRYHHLFNDLLLARLRQSSGQAREADLRRRAALWYSTQGHLSEAIHQAMQAQAYELAANLIENPAQFIRIFESGEVAKILKWTQELPPEVIRKHLWLMLYQSRSLFYTGQAGAAEAILNDIELEIRSGPEIVPQNNLLLGLVLAHKARYASVRDQVTAAREIAQQALKILPPGEIGARSFVFPTLALSAYRMGDVKEAATLFEETAQITRRAGSRFQTIGNLTNLAVTRLAQGMLAEVIRITRQAIQEGMIQGIRLPESGWPCYPLAEALYEQNQLAEAEQTITEGLRLVEEGKLTNYFGQMPALLARIQFALGREEEAQATMESALDQARQTTVAFYVSEIEAFQAQIWIQTGALPRAVRWAEIYQDRPKMERLCEIEEMTLAEVLLASGRVEEALSLLPAMAADAQARGRTGREIPFRALLALAHRALGDEQQARAELERALGLGEPEGYLRPFLRLGEPMADYLRLFVKGIAPEKAGGYRVNRGYIHRILAAFPQEKIAGHQQGRQHPQLIEPLTSREMDVLRLLADGLSNREIAGRLYLSPNTLRVYTTNLYAKLDVHNRTQAVTRARDLGIL